MASRHNVATRERVLLPLERTGLDPAPPTSPRTFGRIRLPLEVSGLGPARRFITPTLRRVQLPLDVLGLGLAPLFPLPTTEQAHCDPMKGTPRTTISSGHANLESGMNTLYVSGLERPWPVLPPMPASKFRDLIKAKAGKATSVDHTVSGIGLFQLPLEVRQMIYELLMPATVKFSPAGCTPLKGTTMASACKANLGLQSELLPWAVRHGTLQITVSDDTTLLPTINYICLTGDIELLIDHHPTAKPCKIAMARLREKITKLVRVISKCRNLKRFSIEFHCSGPRCRDNRRRYMYCGCRYWKTAHSYKYCRYCEDWECSYDDRRRVLSAFDSSDIPIVEDLLTPFLALPPCKSVHLKGIGADGNVETPFGWEYEELLFATVENWLAGYRWASFEELRRLPREMLRVSYERQRREGKERWERQVREWEERWNE